MFYNWKCCSFYPNNFGASALTMYIQLLSTGPWKCFHRPVETRMLASGNIYTGQWKHVHRPVETCTLACG